jgi:citrate lyase beta subunit
LKRPRRALLFVPATDRKKIEKAAGLGADSVIIDLEDSVALWRKAEARVAASAALAEVSFGRSERLVRVNQLETGDAEADIEETGHAASAPEGYVIPKAESSDAIRALAARIDRIEQRRGLPRNSIRLIAIIETARGVVRLREIAAASPRLDGLIFGAEDLCGDIGGTRTCEGTEVAYAPSAVVVHAAAERIQAIDTPFVNLADEPGLLAETRAALNMGYTGKLAIHPKQVPPILSIFTPEKAELDQALRLIAEHDRNQKDGKGVFSLDGKMVDMPMVRAAERVVARARAAGILPPA